MERMPEIPRDEIEIDIVVHPEDIPIRGNAIVSGNDDYDREVEDAIIKELEWNEWAWCTVEVTGSWRGLEESSFLGSCSYKSEDDFKAGGYYDDMVQEVYELLDQRAWDIHVAYT